MCKVGAIKSKVPVHPSKALYLMLSRQGGTAIRDYQSSCRTCMTCSAITRRNRYSPLRARKRVRSWWRITWIATISCNWRDGYRYQSSGEDWISRRGLTISFAITSILGSGRPQEKREELLLDTCLALRQILAESG